MSELSIANVVTISVAEPPAGLAEYKINNLLMVTNETPVEELALGYGVYLAPSDVATDWGSGSEAYAQALKIFGQSPNILTGDGRLIIWPMTGSDTTIADALLEARSSVFYGGALWCNFQPSNEEIEDAAAYAEATRFMLFNPQHLVASVQPGGIIAELQEANYHQARSLLYTTDEGEDNLGARLMAAAYAGRFMSTNFDGSNTTATMHLKDLKGITADDGITQATLELCKEVGADVYANFAGLPKVFSTGGNEFADNVYNLNWLVYALTVAGFNALATTSTKIPQTEPGIEILRNAYIDVLERAVRNGYVAPGAWNSPERFGDPDDFDRNILELGYYVYSQPVNQQSQAAREARQAPLIQVAIKLAGAVHSTSVIIYVNS